MDKVKPTRADREAAAKALSLDGASMNVRLWVAGEWSSDGLLFGAYAERFAQSLADQRAELFRLAAQVAVKVGEHEYARGRRDGFTEGSDRERGWKVDSLEDLLRLGVES